MEQRADVKFENMLRLRSAAELIIAAAISDAIPRSQTRTKPSAAPWGLGGCSCARSSHDPPPAPPGQRAAERIAGKEAGWHDEVH